MQLDGLPVQAAATGCASALAVRLSAKGYTLDQIADVPRRALDRWDGGLGRLGGRRRGSSWSSTLDAALEAEVLAAAQETSRLAPNAGKKQPR